ncbi:hypothetical protein V1524DRAFT_438604 [Lipomyces starkeyi]
MALDATSIIITGDCGQVGIAIVKHLQDQYPKATILDFEKPLASDARFIEKVTYYAGNITDEAILKEIFEAVKSLVVFHTAGLVPQIAKRLDIHTEKDYSAVNVQGTRNVLDAATAVGSVKALVFTSSSDVLKGDSWQDLAGVNESMAIPKVFDDPYAKSKVLLSPWCFLFAGLRWIPNVPFILTLWRIYSPYRLLSSSLFVQNFAGCKCTTIYCRRDIDLNFHISSFS